MKKICTLFLLFLFQNTYAASIEEDTAKYVDQIFSDLAVSNNIFCAPASRRFNSGFPQSDYLLNIASAKNIVVFVHGFAAEAQTGKYSLTEMASTWRYHIDLLEELDSSTSYCVVTWDTEFGFDDEDATLGRFHAALDLALRDTRIDNEVKNVTVVGHSAGGNYIKYSYLYFDELRKKTARLNIPSQTKQYKFHIVTLSTPHLGTTADDNEKTSNYIADMARYLLGGSALYLSSLSQKKSRSRGAKQLQAIEFNEPLYQLNRAFAKIYPEGEIFTAGSSRDASVPLNSANPPFARNYPFHFDQKTFLQPFHSRSFSTFLKIIYQGGHPRRKSND